MRPNREHKPFFRRREERRRPPRHSVIQCVLMIIGLLTLTFLALRYLIIPLLVLLQDVIAV